MDEVFPQPLVLEATRLDVLRYGENPHQLAAVCMATDRDGPAS
jgi:AICAR transformylase/IMP cyclohydrolase PurH